MASFVCIFLPFSKIITGFYMLYKGKGQKISTKNRKKTVLLTFIDVN